MLVLVGLLEALAALAGLARLDLARLDRLVRLLLTADKEGLVNTQLGRVGKIPPLTSPSCY